MHFLEYRLHISIKVLNIVIKLKPDETKTVFRIFLCIVIFALFLEGIQEELIKFILSTPISLNVYT